MVLPPGYDSTTATLVTWHDRQYAQQKGKGQQRLDDDGWRDCGVDEWMQALYYCDQAVVDGATYDAEALSKLRG